VFGALTTKRTGTIFALISLGVGELVYAAAFMLPSIFGGEEGITASRTRAPIDFGVALGSQLEVYYAVIAWALAAALSMYAFTQTPVGRMCNAVRDNPERAEFVGYSTQRVRFIAFAIAGLFAGIAGGLHAINYEIVGAEAVSAQRSGTVLIMTYIGGATHFMGPVLGAIVITWLQSSLSEYTSAWLLYLGVFFIGVILYAPSGLAGLILTHRPIARTRGMRGVLAAYGMASVPLVIMATGAVLAIEMAYRLATQPELGTRMRLLWMSLDAASSWPWIVSAIALVGGFLLFRATRGFVATAWEHARSQVMP
jgi:branched-chain amino acid transport system permease protein